MAELKKSSVKSKVEAILFSVGHKISLDEISRLSRSRKEEVLAALKELQSEYEQKQSSIMLVDEGDDWKFAVRDHLVSVVRKIVTETELTKSVMETLAVIAFKYPILQSDLIKMRTNKAYDHLVELEKTGYISRQKHSRTNLIKLTEKFFRYFDLTEEKLRDKFRDFDSIARAIKEKETEVDQIKDDQKKKAEDLKQQDDKIRKEIESLDKVDEEFKIPLDTYEEKQNEEPQQNKENQELKEEIGLEVVNLPKESIKKEEKTEYEKEPEADEIQTSNEEIQIKKPRSRGIHITPDMEKKIDERVSEIVHGEQKENPTQ
ncbi:SMC-Scp complex subunit ScpB [Candidatus Woesearchaeota archaeon]|nr:SMC-Scp complex subunit ScpB [Candidatus Woesearchaeota archaeon]